jgi:uroporphyrinogen decarboxylase
VILPEEHPLNTGKTSSSSLVLNMRGQRTSPLPVWFMRQAGRSLPEYRKLREGVAMLDSCLTPDIVVEITLQPVRRHGVDAAIFFSDIVIPLKLAGLEVDIQAGVGPVMSNPVRTQEDADKLALISPEAFAPITEAVTRLVQELDQTPLIGFGGAPFTLASYLIEGGPSQTLPYSRAMMKDQPQLWGQILTWCADVTAQFIRAQVTAGASALQVFDSWAGRLTSEEYEQFAKPYSVRLFAALSTLVDNRGQPVPRVHFGVGTEAILESMHDAGATVMGIDSSTDLAAASKRFDNEVPVQGNISTEKLTSSWDELAAHLEQVIESGRDAPGHILNLGHGVPADTDPRVLTRITEHIHRVTS